MLKTTMNIMTKPPLDEVENESTVLKDSDYESEVRYNLRLPRSIYQELERQAERLGTNRLELIRKFIKLGLVALSLEQEPNSGLYIRRNGEFERVLLL